MEREIMTSAGIGLGLFAISFLAREYLINKDRREYRKNYNANLDEMMDPKYKKDKIGLSKIDKQMDLNRNKFDLKQIVYYFLIPGGLAAGSIYAMFLEIAHSNQNLIYGTAVFGLLHLAETISYRRRLKR